MERLEGEPSGIIDIQLKIITLYKSLIFKLKSFFSNNYMIISVHNIKKNIKKYASF